MARLYVMQCPTPAPTDFDIQPVVAGAPRGNPFPMRTAALHYLNHNRRRPTRMRTANLRPAGAKGVLPAMADFDSATQVFRITAPQTKSRQLKRRSNLSTSLRAFRSSHGGRQ